MGPHTKWERPTQRAKCGAGPGPGGENGAAGHCAHGSPRASTASRAPQGSLPDVPGRGTLVALPHVVASTGIWRKRHTLQFAAIALEFTQKQLPGLCALQVPGGGCPPPQTQDGSQSQRMPPSEDRAANAVRQGNALETHSDACVDATSPPPQGEW